MPYYPPAGGGTAGPLVRATGRRTAGDVVAGSTAGAWVAYDTATDLTLTAATGDLILISVDLLTTGASGGAFDLDIVTIVSGAQTNFVSSGGAAAAVNGLPGLYSDTGFRKGSGPFPYTVQAGDLSAGSITFRIVYRATTGGTFYGSTNYPFAWAAINFSH